jgi:hypothetical protein
VYCDNQIGIHVAKNLMTHGKMKNVELHCHYLMQLLQNVISSLIYCRTNDQFVDIFTNPLPKDKILKLQAMLRLQESTIKGGVQWR